MVSGYWNWNRGDPNPALMKMKVVVMIDDYGDRTEREQRGPATGTGTEACDVLEILHWNNTSWIG